MDTLLHSLVETLGEWHFPDESVNAMATAILAAGVLLIAALVRWVLRNQIQHYVLRLVEYTEVKWDDIIFNPKVLQALWYMVVSFMLRAMLPPALELYPRLEHFTAGLCDILVVLAITVLIVRLFSSAYELTLSSDRNAPHSLKGLFQMVQLIVICIAVIIVISIVIGRDPVFVLSGLGAAAAILMLVFQDTILGLVAGIQLTANDMLRPGDWISAPACHANGTVLEVTLTTVKVQNFDMTITTIPPYTLVKGSFQNWRGMRDSGGRRIKRSFNIDMTTVGYAGAELLERCSRSEWWPASEDIASGGGRPVNLTLFRRYLGWYIGSQPSLCEGFTWMVRELEPTPLGLPIEIYLFTSRQEWRSYEMLQAEMIDHILATVSEFGLRIFQSPTGADIRTLSALKPEEPEPYRP